MRIGVITYDHPHLKTEQVVRALLKYDYELTLFALPFSPRRTRPCVFEHRPCQFDAVHPQRLAEQCSLVFRRCASDSELPGGFDYYIITGAGILSPRCLEGKKIINCHPGLLPICRGLDAFKWAIYDNIPVGNTLHFIDENIDEGRVIFRRLTPVYAEDTIQAFAMRHYRSEIGLLSTFPPHLTEPVDSLDLSAFPRSPAHPRMPVELEPEMLRRFSLYKKTYLAAP